MSARKVCLALSGACVLAMACTLAHAVKPQSVRIERLYLRVAHGFFIERALLRRPGGMETWAEVRLRDAGAYGPRYDMARLPDDQEYQHGDVVEATLVSPFDAAAGPFLSASVVTRMVAPAGTLYALTFGTPPPSLAQTTPRAPAACQTLLASLPAGAGSFCVAPDAP